MTIYHEPGRTWIGPVVTGALLVAGFLLDVALGAGIDHLPGWAGAFVILVGLHLFVVHAARATHSLDVTVDEVQVGEESVRRADIASGRIGVDRSLPVLGWTGGLPRGAKGLTVRLVDDRECVIPTRRPKQVADVLKVRALSRPMTIRPAEPADLDVIPEIDERAEVMFGVAGLPLPRIAFDVGGLPDAAVVFVAGSPPVGFVQVDIVDGSAHVAELSVLPGSMRRGLGGGLLEEACAWARTSGYGDITLITYADVPWNAPFYARHGFVEMPDLGPELGRRRRRQTELGLDAVGRRIAMRREL